MAQIKIYGDIESSSVFFINSTIEPKPMGTIVASLKYDEDRIIVKRNDRFDSGGVEFRQLFKRLNPNRVQNKDGQDLVGTLGYTTQEVIDYINGQANLSSGSSGGDGSGTDLTGLSMGFKLDATSTSIMLDNGLEFGVNTIKAFDNGDGLISISSELGSLTHFNKLDHTLVTGHDGNAVSGGLNDVINYLNELFTVGAFTSVVISDPYSTMIADVNGVVTTEVEVAKGTAIEIGTDEYGATTTGYNYAGYVTPEQINQAGEYFTFNIRNEGMIGFGLVPSQEDFDNGDFNGNSSYADPTTFANGPNSGNYGYQFSHWFHPSPNGPWTNYGANVGYTQREGWSNATYRFSSSPEGAKWLAGDLVKIKVGIDENNFIVVSYFDESTSLFVPIARTTYPVPNGLKFHLGIKFGDTTVRLVGLPKIHELEDLAPTMTFRYIESPDGVYHYPLFSTSEEAEYYDKIVNGVESGASHTHTYTDDPTNTTWYMPEASHDASTYQYSYAPSGSETFSGNAVTYTEVTSLTNADLTPSVFSGSDITQEEATNVNIQVTPTGASWTTSVAISPSGSGLVYDGYSILQGTLADVGSDTTYTVTVTRANSYGSSVGTFTITATDVAPVQTNDTAWTKAIDFSGSSEYLKHMSGNATASKNPLGLSSGTYITPNSNPLYTANSSSSRPWAQTIVFKADGHNSLQCIWNNGEGFYSGADNFGLEIDANDTLWFYYGQGATTAGNYNKCYVQIGIDTSKWYGVYIAHKGGRLSGNNATKANLGECFDIRVMSSADSFATISPNRSGSNSGGNWQVTGRRMDKSVNGMYTIGATASSQKPFYGKVASSVITTLKNNSLAPVEAEIKTMIIDPIKWENDYKQGTTFRASDSSSTASVPSTPSVSYQYATQLHLMGDSIGIYPYSNNDAYPDIFNNLRWYTSTKMTMQNMVSNDIETVNINGLT